MQQNIKIQARRKVIKSSVLLIMQTWIVRLKKCIPVKIILKNLVQRKKQTYVFWLFIVYKLLI